MSISANSHLFQIDVFAAHRLIGENEDIGIATIGKDAELPRPLLGVRCLKMVRPRAWACRSS